MTTIKIETIEVRHAGKVKRFITSDGGKTFEHAGRMLTRAECAALPGWARARRVNVTVARKLAPEEIAAILACQISG